MIPGGYVSIAGGVPTNTITSQTIWGTSGKCCHPIESYKGKELETFNNFETLDYGARMYDSAISRFYSFDNSSENYYSQTPYNYVGNNPIKRVDPDGNDWWDTVVGTAIGVVTNVVPGSTSLRNSYTPTDAAAMVVGEGMVKGGSGAITSGLSVAAVAGTASLALVDVPLTVTVAAGGVVLMAKGAANTSKGYNYGEKIGTKLDNKLKPSPEASGDHSSFKTAGSGKTTNTAKYKQNSKKPSGFDEVKRVDVTGKAHNGVNTLHVHEPKQQVRPARPDELPKQK